MNKSMNQSGNTSSSSCHNSWKSTRSNGNNQKVLQVFEGHGSISLRTVAVSVHIGDHLKFNSTITNQNAFKSKWIPSNLITLNNLTSSSDWQSIKLATARRRLPCIAGGNPSYLYPAARTPTSVSALFHLKSFITR